MIFSPQSNAVVIESDRRITQPVIDDLASACKVLVPYNQEISMSDDTEKQRREQAERQRQLEEQRRREQAEWERKQRHEKANEERTTDYFKEKPPKK